MLWFLVFYSLCGHGLQIRAIRCGTYPRGRGGRCVDISARSGFYRPLDISEPSGTICKTLLIYKHKKTLQFARFFYAYKFYLQSITSYL